MRKAGNPLLSFNGKAKKAVVSLMRDQSGHTSQSLTWLGVVTIWFVSAFFLLKDHELFHRRLEPVLTFLTRHERFISWTLSVLFAVCIISLVVHLVIEDHRIRAFLRRLEEERGVSKSAGQKGD